jgi:endonuclease
MRSPYLNHFESFIDANLTSPETTFTKEDMVAWVQQRDSRRSGTEHVRNIVEHLLKRVTNYNLRDDNDPPSRLHDDLFFMLESNLFRRYLPEKDPPPFHLAEVGEISQRQRDVLKVERIRQQAIEGRFSYEQELQLYLKENPERLEQGLILYPNGMEYWTRVGLIDLLCKDRDGNLVILELKVAGTSDQVSGQLQRYMGWITSNLASAGQKVRGIIVAQSISEKLYWATRRDADVELYEYRVVMHAGEPSVSFTKISDWKNR